MRCEKLLPASLLSCLFFFLFLPLIHGVEDRGSAVAPEGNLYRAMQEALLRDDLDEARRILRTVPIPEPGMPDTESRTSRLSLFEALVKPEPERARALLAVARAFPHREEGLTALTACLSLLERAVLNIKESCSKKEIGSMEEIFLSCSSLLESWKGRGEDDPRIDLATILLLECRKNLAVEGPARLGPPIYLQSMGRYDEIPVPTPLAEEVRVLLHDLDFSPREALIHDRTVEYLKQALTPFVEKDPGEESYSDDLLQPGLVDLGLAAPDPGTYLMEAHSTGSGWTRRQVLVVTDLDLTAQAGADGFALLATLRGVPVPGVEILRTGTGGKEDEERLIGCTDEQGLLVAPFPEDVKDDPLLLVGRKDGHRKTIILTRADPFHETPPEVTAHLFCDRSVYRPGETVSGRLLVRRHDSLKPLPGLISSSVDSEPVSSPLAGREIVVELSHKKEWEHSIRIRTDSFGAACFTFDLPLAAPVGPVDVRAWLPLTWEREFRWAVKPGRDRDPQVELGEWRSILHVQDYRRPPLLWDVAWPEGRQRKDKAPEVMISATYPTGAPACGLKGRFAARLGRTEQTVPFVLDGRGKAVVSLGTDELDLPFGKVEIRCRASITAADGQTLTKENKIVLVPGSRLVPTSSPRPAAAAKWRHNRYSDSDTRLRLSFPNGAWPAGKDLPLSLTGPPGAPVLLTIGRAGLLHARVVTLGLAGKADLLLPTRPEWCPRVYLTAAVPACFLDDRFSLYFEGESRWQNDDRHLDLFVSEYLPLEEPPGQLHVSLERESSAYGPGEEVCWTVVTRDSEGSPVPATVALSVLDERLARLMDDSLKDAGSALYPRWWWDRTIFRRGRVHSSLERVFFGLIRKGRVISPFVRVDRQNPSASCGGASARRGGKAKPRVTFRKTAFFDGSILTGPDGRAAVRFTFPDDLTTWRIVLVAVDSGRQAALLEEKVETRRDPAVTPLLPRILRQGDRVAIPTLVQSVESGLPPGGHVAVETRGALRLEPGDWGTPFPPSPGHSQTRTAVVHGDSVGQALFRAKVLDRQGGTMDQVDLTLAVQPREICRKLYSVAAIKGEVVLDPPRLEGRKPARLFLEIAGSLSAFIPRAEIYLDEYPHGCAEQVSSCMTPALIALHPGLGRTPLCSLSPERARRLEAGLNRLRIYQNGDGGFTWWGSGSTDLQITACVLRFLDFAREAGMLLDDYGIRLDPDCDLFSRTGGQLDGALSSGVEWTVEPRLCAEIAACRLALFPSHPTARAACLRLVPHLSDLPSGLLARLGQALIVAEEKDAADKIAALLRNRIKGKVSEPVAGGFLTESPASRLAAALEFFLAARPDDPLRPRLVSMLLSCFDGECFDHTFGTASALVALSRVQAAFPPAAEAESCHVQVTAPGFSEEFVLHEESGWQAACSIPAGRGPVRMANRSGPVLQTVLRADFVEDGAAALALAHPIEVRRELYRVVPDETGALTRREPARKFRVGEIVDAVITVKATGRKRYLVIECPVPAGFEVIRREKNVKVRDDRVVFSLHTAEEVTWRPRFQAALVGRVAWPPVRAEDMYDRECWGRSAGCRIDVGPAAALHEVGKPVRILTRREMENRVSWFRNRLARADTAEEMAAALREEAALPFKSGKEWLFCRIPEIAGALLENQELAHACVSLLGYRAEERFQGDHLDEIAALKGEKRDAVLVSLARALEKSGHGPWALRLLNEKKGLKENEIDLFTLVVFFDDEDLYGDGVLDFFGRFTSHYSKIPEEHRLQAIMDRISEIEEPIPYSDEDQEAIHLAEASSLIFWAWDRADLEDKVSLHWCLEELLDEDRPGKKGAAKSSRHAALDVIHARLRAEAAAAVLDQLDLLACERWIEPEDFWDHIDTLLGRATEGLKRGAARKLLAEAASRIVKIRSLPGREQRFLVAAADFLNFLSGEQRSIAGDGCLDALALPVFHFCRTRQAEELSLDYDFEDLLSDRAKASLPCSILLSLVLNEKEEWAAEELLRRGGADRDALLEAAPRIDDSTIADEILRRVPIDRLCSLPLSRVTHLVAADDRWWGGRAGKFWKRLRQSIAKGPVQNEKIARMLARSRNPDLRFLLVQALAERGWSEVPFSPKDPSASFYSKLLLARLGDTVGRGELWAVLFESERSWENWELLDILWAVEPSMDLEKLIRLKTVHPDLFIPTCLIRPMLSRMDPEGIMEFLQRGDLNAGFISWVADDMSEKKIREIAPLLIELDLQGTPFVRPDRFFPVLVADRSMMKKIFLSAQQLSLSVAFDLLYCKHDDRIDTLALAGRLLSHWEEDVREQSRTYLECSLGDPRTWVPESMSSTATADSCLEAAVDLRMAVFLKGVEAVEEALESSDPAERGAAWILMARSGLDLSPLAGP